MEEAILKAKAGCFRDALCRGEDLKIKVTGNSMLPFLKNGQIVVIRACDVKEINIGDIVLTFADNRILCHRVFRKGKDIFQTKADALIWPDLAGSKDTLLGKVIAIETDGRIRSMEGSSARYAGWIISRVTAVTAIFYPVLRWIKRLFSAFRVKPVDSTSGVKDSIISLIKIPFKIDQKLQTLLRAEFNWEFFLENIFKEGLDGIIFYNLSQHKQEYIIPDWAFEQLKQNYLNNAGRNLFISRQIENIFAEFALEEIPLLLLRGADFFKSLYPDMGMRAMSDVDMVVHKKDLPKVKALFERLRYSHPQGYVYLFSKDGVFFDIHPDVAGFWRVNSWPRCLGIRDRDVWQKAVVVNQEAPLIKTLWLYDAILCCCAHAQEHSFSRLIWFYDVALLIKKNTEEFSADILIDRARQYNLEKPLFFVMRYIEEKKLIALPERIIAFMRQILLGGFEKKSLRMLLSDRRECICGELLYLFSIPDIFKRMQCVWDAIFVKKELFPLSARRITVWNYLVRFLKIAGYSLKKMFAVLCH